MVLFFLAQHNMSFGQTSQSSPACNHVWSLLCVCGSFCLTVCQCKMGNLVELGQPFLIQFVRSFISCSECARLPSVSTVVFLPHHRWRQRATVHCTECSNGRKHLGEGDCPSFPLLQHITQSSSILTSLQHTNE